MTTIVNQCIEYINNNYEEIVNAVDTQFTVTKEFITAKILCEVRKYITPIPEHFVWENDGCPYDYSGIIRVDGVVDLNQTLYEFLENELTGAKKATYISNYGFHYTTYGDILSYFTLEIAEYILQKTTKQYLEEKLDVCLSEQEFQDVMDDCHDIIYDECIASDFFLWEGAIEFLNIGERSLISIAKKGA